MMTSIPFSVALVYPLLIGIVVADRKRLTRSVEDETSVFQILFSDRFSRKIGISMTSARSDADKSQQTLLLCNEPPVARGISKLCFVFAHAYEFLKHISDKASQMIRFQLIVPIEQLGE